MESLADSAVWFQSQAALGLAQLSHLEEAVARKREVWSGFSSATRQRTPTAQIGQLYTKLLEGCPGLVLPPDWTSARVKLCKDLKLDVWLGQKPEV